MYEDDNNNKINIFHNIRSTFSTPGNSLLSMFSAIKDITKKYRVFSKLFRS